MITLTNAVRFQLFFHLRTSDKPTAKKVEANAANSSHICHNASHKMAEKAQTGKKIFTKAQLDSYLHRDCGTTDMQMSDSQQLHQCAHSVSVNQFLHVPLNITTAAIIHGGPKM